MQSKNLSADGSGGIAKKILFPSFADAGSNDAFLAPVNEKIYQKLDGEDTIQSQPTSTAPPKKHNVEYDGSQVGGYAPSDTPNSTLFSDVEGSVCSPLEPQKLLAEDSVSTSLNVSADLSRDMSMIVHTGACAEKQNESINIAENSIMEEDEFEAMEEEEVDEEEDDFIDSIKSLASPIFEKVDGASGNTRTPIGTSIISPPNMSRHVQIHDDSNPSIQDDRASSSMREGEAPLQKPGGNDSQFINNVSPIHKAPSPNLFRTQSYGEQSETPSSLLGCNFLRTGEKLSHGVPKQCDTQSNKVYNADRLERLMSEKKSAEHGEGNNIENNQIKNDTAERGSDFEHAEKFSLNRNSDDDSSGDANSLVSEYGSDIGDLKIRLDDVYAMAAVEEEEEEQVTNFVNTNQDGKCHTKSDLKFSPVQDLENDPRISYDNRDGNKENYANHSTRVASPNLVWSDTGIEIESGKGKFKSLKSKADLSSPASPVQRDSNSSTTPTTPIAAVSAAFRRIGNGVSNIARGSKSPSTFDPTLNVDLDIKNSSKSEGFQLSPRLGSFSFRKTTSIEESSKTSPARMMQSVRDQITSPLHHARSGCLSLVPESGLPPYANMLRINDSPPASPMLLPKTSQLKSHSTGHSPRLRFKSQSWEAGSNRACDNQGDRITDIDIELDRKKAIKDKPGSNLFSGLSATSTGAAFRNNGGSILIREGQPFQPAISPSRRRHIINSSGHLNKKESVETVSTNGIYPPILLQSPQRVGDVEKEDAFDILALLVERSIAFHEKTDQLSGSTSIEDSIDHERTIQSDSSQPSSIIPESSRNKNIADKIRTQPCLSSSVSDVQDSIEELRVISKNHSDGSTTTVNHSTRMVALDELQRSYTYALEMKRAALSASTWLRAIGRSDKNGEHTSTANIFIDETVSKSNVEIEQTQSQYSDSLNICDSVIDERMKMKPDSLRLALQSDQLQFTAKDELNKRLDHELSVCRAEIGRLKSLSRSEGTFISPNKSILDEEGDDDSSASSNEEEFLKTETCTDISFLEFSDAKDIDVSRDLSASQTLSGTVESKRELLILKAELAQANKKIYDMEKLQQHNLHGEPPPSVDPIEIVANDEGEEIESCYKSTEKDPPLSKDNVTGPVEDDQHDLLSESHGISFSNDLLKKDLDNYIEAIRKADKAKIEYLNKRLEETDQSKENDGKADAKMINVRMLDGENFVTEWTKLGPLPPPPDHDLHSPIVTALLSQWTDDCLTRDALISWMEKLIGGADPNSVPPLKLSSLDHQVRDGFTMHILPLLLRRSDLYLEVTSRAQRRTSYDVIATVKNTQSILCDSISLQSQDETSTLTAPSLCNNVSGSHMMAFKASGGINASNDSMEERASPHDKSKFTSQGTCCSDEIESGSVTHSSITEFISNHITKSSHLERCITNARPSGSSADSNVAGDDSGARSGQLDSSTHKNQQQPSMMAGAINAVGGLLSRRKHHQSPHSSRRVISFEEDKHHGSPSQCHPPGLVLLPTLGKSPKKKFKNPFPILSSSTLARGRADPPKSTTLIENLEEDQPYHRVVSAPPGRIGMTFVQYRGHAIISDVYQTSPLQGWVFPSDILIAIDEVPVSGMRVLEIVKLLNARKDRQRALRVISSHAMTDLMITQNSAALMDG